MFIEWLNLIKILKSKPKNHRKCEKTEILSQQREELLQLVTTERGTCHKQKKMELLRIGASLSYYKVFHRIFITSRNEKKKRYLWLNLSF